MKGRAFWSIDRRTLLVSLVFLALSWLVTLLAAATVVGLPPGDVPATGALLGGAGLACGALALLVVRPAVLGRLGGVRAQLVGAGLVGSFLLLGMMLAGARAMFISGHDFKVVLTMLLFAAMLSGGFSLLCAAPMAGRIERIRAGTALLAAGEPGPQLPADGHDELAALARDFNRMSEALREASRRGREAEAARRELVAAVSHDLRTPLASALALIEAVADGVAGDRETEERYLRSAGGELRHLGRLVDDLFELAKVDSGVMDLVLEECSLGDLVSDTLSGLRSRAQERGVRLVGEVPGEADPVLASPPKLQRVLRNLLGNALRHTPADGTVAVRAERRGEEVLVEVSDTGEGIAPEDLDRVFERSFRGERSRSRTGAAAGDTEADTGAGLGLAIARGLIEAHGGVMTVESRPGEGACFRFTLRRA